MEVNNKLEQTITRDVKDLLAERLHDDIRALLDRICRVADELKYGAYLVGGPVRDLLLGVPNFDIDIVVEGNGIAFASKLGEYSGGKIRVHKEFGTATIILPRDAFTKAKPKVYKIDVATARRESYEHPAALPRVEASSLRDDLRRRDFTINSMAIILNPDGFGYLIDSFGGQRDVANGVVRVLHDLSFVDDPTRIFRAIRFEKRYNFRIDSQTEHLIEDAIKMEVFEKLDGRRVRNEIVLILSEPDPIKPIERVAEFGLMRYIHPDIRWNNQLASEITEVSEVISSFETMIRGKRTVKWLIYFMALIDQLDLGQVESLVERLKLSKRDVSKLITAKRDLPGVIKELKETSSPRPSSVCQLLGPIPREVLLFMVAKARSNRVSERLTSFLTKWRKVRTRIDGQDLKKLGYQPGPAFGQILTQVLKAKLDDQVITRADEIRYANELAQEIIKGRG